MTVQPGTERWNLNDAHVWAMEGNKRVRWVGFFYDARVALQWVHTQKGTFEVNNIPPDTSNRVIRAKEALEAAERKYATPRHSLGSVHATRVTSTPSYRPTKKDLSVRSQAAAKLKELKDSEVQDMNDGVVEDLR